MIVLNRAKCLLCDDTITSLTAHDFNMCRCGNLTVDGGKEYLRRGVLDSWDTMEEQSIITDTFIEKETGLKREAYQPRDARINCFYGGHMTVAQPEDWVVYFDKPNSKAYTEAAFREAFTRAETGV